MSGEMVQCPSCRGDGLAVVAFTTAPRYAPSGKLESPLLAPIVIACGRCGGTRQVKAATVGGDER